MFSTRPQENIGTGISMETIDGVDYEINGAYEYEDQDTAAILNAILRVEYNGLVGNIPIYGMGAVDTITPHQLEQRLRQEMDSHPAGSRLVLIPCNIGNYHWVGLLLEFDEANACIRAEFLNSTNSDIPPTLQRQLESIYHRRFVKRHDVIKQSDGTSCGACAIANLILRMQSVAPPGGVRMAQIRAYQLNVLRIDDNEPGIPEHELAARRRFFEAFNQRQRLNQRTFDSTQWRFFKDDSCKSESEMLAITALAESVSAIYGPAREQILAAFNTILDGAKEHKFILDRIRDVLWECRGEAKVQALVGSLFGSKDIIGMA
ncbi:MAG: hypothetical protein KAT71_03170, partial [Gammaproteobacteria bacterium]|nr:hypothetical protein [Gammaproteobacteria bacterium]